MVLCNPPYLVNDEKRACLHGGDAPGRAKGVAIASQALERLQPGGRLILYTGVAIVNGVNQKCCVRSGERRWRACGRKWNLLNVMCWHAS